jgi:hypothetical protein
MGPAPRVNALYRCRGGERYQRAQELPVFSYRADAAVPRPGLDDQGRSVNAIQPDINQRGPGRPEARSGGSRCWA